MEQLDKALNQHTKLAHTMRKIGHMVEIRPILLVFFFFFFFAYPSRRRSRSNGHSRRQQRGPDFYSATSKPITVVNAAMKEFCCHCQVCMLQEPWLADACLQMETAGR
ncbi:hypothetical protein QJQ45_016445 [Haematococcus lacustris]|nr:hypothetical protein QJQ45_016445 [Haematococcus lacustris]